MHLSDLRKGLAAATIAVLLGGTSVGCMPPDKTAGTHSSIFPSTASTMPSTTAAALPVPADFVVGVIVTEQKCYGSAGCNYRYTINPQYISAKPLPANTTVVFTVTGGDQEQIGNFTINEHGTATFDRETGISGPEGADLRATVTQVIPGR